MLQLYYKRTSFEQIIVSEIIRPLMFRPFRQLVQCLFATNGDQFIEMNEPEGSNAFTISKTKIGTAAQANCTIRLAVSQSVRRRLCKAEM